MAHDSPEVSALFHDNLDMVGSIAGQLLRSTGLRCDRDELEAAGRAGLLEAARRYEPERGVPFRAYATYRVRGAMVDAARTLARLPRRVWERLRAWEAASEASAGAAEDVLANPPRGGVEAAERALTAHIAAMTTAMTVGLLTAPAFGEEGEITGRDVEPTPEESVARRQLLELIVSEIDQLPPPEDELLRRHYLAGEQLDHVGKELGLSKSWASRLHTRAVARLSKRLAAEAT